MRYEKAIVGHGYYLIFSSICLCRDRVYDDDDQYLGILVDENNDNVRFYIPSLNKFSTIKLKDGDIPFGTAYLAYNEPTLTSYFVNMNHIFRKADKLCTGIPPAILKNITFFCTFREISGYQRCEGFSISTGIPYFVYEIVEMPVESLPFTVPVALPLHYEYVVNAFAPHTIPTLTTYGIILMSCIITLLGIIQIKRKEKLSFVDAIKQIWFWK